MTGSHRSTVPRHPRPALPLAPATLLGVTRELATEPRHVARARAAPTRRALVRTPSPADDDHDTWLIGWDSFQGVDLHDHGGSAGALYVVEGELLETSSPSDLSARLHEQRSRRHRARVRPRARAPRREPVGRGGDEHPRVLSAVGEHGLLRARRGTMLVAYAHRAGARIAIGTRRAAVTPRRRRPARRGASAAAAGLAGAKPRPRSTRGALLVDTRPEWQRRAEGEIPGALLIERNHLEWRLDPTSDARIPEAVDHDVEVIVMCSEGYSSSLAAASLQDLGPAPRHRSRRRVPGLARRRSRPDP